MKDLIKKYYDIDIDYYYEYKDGIVFFISGKKYYFIKCDYDGNYLLYLKDICEKYEYLKLHKMIFNKNRELLSEGNILLEIQVLEDQIDLYDIKKFMVTRCDEYLKDYITMDKFWEDKIDYLEYQLTELSDNKLINNSFDYYLGIAEILISYYKNNYNNSNNHLCISHRCLNSLLSFDYYNPLNICIDNYYKDIIGYIRLTKDKELFCNIVDRIKNKDDYIYFFIRMVFPFEYFYEISNILVDKASDSKLIKIINSNKEYEDYLFEMERLFGIKIFSWLKKNVIK